MIPEGYTPCDRLYGKPESDKENKGFLSSRSWHTVSGCRRVSAPLFVAPETGLNDNLNGVERTVSFTVKGHG